ncbi:Txe/YoeB family addiction module toxin [Streptococcus tangpeifui]|uniref:Txe/YoeB family addiction module toxin n=1 Tax=Streptococcus tangpeifui TaxID=2709400 RepID=UPI0013EC1B3B|nr:Txe/YoeB family addiction module toxin [Streptococcus sp. ZJ1593]
MPMKFTDSAWRDYCYWQNQDKKTLKRINRILKDVQRSPFEGIGKPEPLRHDYQGAWSRRIDAENRLVYLIEDDGVTFISLRDHY